jgi:hypothetical protein
MRDALDDQIEAYESLLPSIRRENRSGWVLVADRQLVKIFTSFPEAARYARQRFGSKQVLIRHTEERELESAPFVQVHAEG